jgi:hypothetical protein
MGERMAPPRKATRVRLGHYRAVDGGGAGRVGWVEEREGEAG